MELAWQKGTDRPRRKNRITNSKWKRIPLQWGSRESNTIKGWIEWPPIRNRSRDTKKGKKERKREGRLRQSKITEQEAYWRRERRRTNQKRKREGMNSFRHSFLPSFFLSFFLPSFIHSFVNQALSPTPSRSIPSPFPKGNLALRSANESPHRYPPYSTDRGQSSNRHRRRMGQFHGYDEEEKGNDENHQNGVIRSPNWEEPRWGKRRGEKRRERTSDMGKREEHSLHWKKWKGKKRRE